MRLLIFIATLGCASRSTLHATRADGGDLDAAVDAPVETSSREVAGSACAARPSACPVDDFGPLKTAQAVFAECTAATGAACGDLRLVFDAEGCLERIEEIAQYSTAFVDCVERTVGARRWQCAIGGAGYHMLESCER